MAELASLSARVLPGMPQCPGSQSSIGWYWVSNSLCSSRIMCIMGCVGLMVVWLIASSDALESVAMIVFVRFFSWIVRYAV